MAYKQKRSLGTLHKQAARRRTWPKKVSLAQRMTNARTAAYVGATKKKS